MELPQQATPGRRLALSLPRRWMNDILELSRAVVPVAGERVLRLRGLTKARRQMARPVSWNAIMMKAYGIVSARMPLLRQAYLTLPWPHLYESSHSVAAVVLHRQWNGEHVTFGAPIRGPETLPLTAIQGKLDQLKNAKIEEQPGFRRLIVAASFPRPIRRIGWNFLYHYAGRLRARYFGTFGINSMALMRGRGSQFSILTTSMLYYDRVIDERMTIQIAFDHRVFDAYIVGLATSELESVLNREILEELRSLADQKADAHSAEELQDAA